MRPFSVDDFPRLGEPAAAGVTLPAATFCRGGAPGGAGRQQATSPGPSSPACCSTAEDEGLRLVATDSYRLAVRDLPGSRCSAPGQKVLRAVAGAAASSSGACSPDVGEITLRLGERDATFEAGGDPHQHPPDRRRVPELPPAHPGVATRTGSRVGREPLLDALRRVRVWPRDATPVRLTIEADELELNTVNQDRAPPTRCVDAQYGGQRSSPWPSTREYLADGVEAATGDEVVLDTLDALKPAVVRPVDREDFLYLLMPVRVP